MPIAPDTELFNIGELMARGTNGLWKAALHRLLNPPAELAADNRRLLVMFVHNRSFDAPVTALPET